MADEQDMPPPLEDMSELIQQVDSLREFKKHTETPKVKKPSLQHSRNTSTSTSSKDVVNRSKHSPTISANIETTKCVDNDSKTTESQTNKSSHDVKSSTNVAKTNSSFGGMKKGFMFGGPLKSKQATKSDSNTSPVLKNIKKSDVKSGKTLEDIPFIKKNDNAQQESLKLSEVQETMEKTNAKLLENKDWVTDDLLTNLEKNEKLTKRLQDPTFIQAIGEFQKNPTQAMQKYGDNKEVQEFFQDFCGLMGNHFTNLDKQQDNSSNSTKVGQSSVPSQPNISVLPEGGADLSVRSSTNPKQATAQDEAQMQHILSDPEIRLIMMDPKIQDLFQHLRNNPDKAQRILQTADRELGPKIQKLCSVGLLQFQK